MCLNHPPNKPPSCLRKNCLAWNWSPEPKGWGLLYLVNLLLGARSTIRRVCVWVCVHVCTCVYVVCVHMYVHVCACVYVCMCCVSLCVCMCVHAHVCVYVCMCVLVSVCVCVFTADLCLLSQQKTTRSGTCLNRAVREPLPWQLKYWVTACPWVSLPSSLPEPSLSPELGLAITWLGVCSTRACGLSSRPLVWTGNYHIPPSCSLPC